MEHNGKDDGTQIKSEKKRNVKRIGKAPAKIANPVKPDDYDNFDGQYYSDHYLDAVFNVSDDNTDDESDVDEDTYFRRLSRENAKIDAAELADSDEKICPLSLPDRQFELASDDEEDFVTGSITKATGKPKKTPEQLIAEIKGKTKTGRRARVNIEDQNARYKNLMEYAEGVVKKVKPKDPYHNTRDMRDNTGLDGKHFGRIEECLFGEWVSQPDGIDADGNLKYKKPRLMNANERGDRDTELKEAGVECQCAVCKSRREFKTYIDGLDFEAFKAAKDQTKMTQSTYEAEMYQNKGDGKVREFAGILPQYQGAWRIIPKDE